VLLPLLILAAILARKPMVKDAFAPPQNGKALPVVIAEKQVGKNLLQLKGNSAGETKQLLWVNREALKVASATIYLTKADATTIEGATYIGRIETRGNYVFALPTQSDYHFLLYDFIHQQVIEHIAFNAAEISNREGQHKANNLKP
jgi:hypothetical protein